MYDLTDYLAMIDDRRRTSAYLIAMRATIRPGDVVLELGTGFGYFAVEAARLGASHVWAAEPNDAIDLGPALAARHGVADRITFVQRESTQLSLPRRADVLLEDLRGVSPLLGGRIRALQDARERLLQPGARWIAERDHLMVSPASAPTCPPLESGAIPVQREELDLSAVRVRAASAWRRIGPDAVRPLAPAVCWTTLDLAQSSTRDVSGRASFEVTTDGTFGGWASWFDAELAGGARLPGGPDSSGSVYQCGWFPLAEPVPVRTGDRVDVHLRAIFDGSEYVWAWDTTIRPVSGAGETRRLRQSDLASRVLSAERRRRRAATHVPTPTAAHRLRQELLALADGVRSLEAIAAELSSRHPARFTDARRALAWAGLELARFEEEPGP